MKQEKISKIIGELADHHIEDALEKMAKSSGMCGVDYILFF